MYLLLRQFKIEGAVQNSHSAHKIWSQKMQSESPAPASAGCVWRGGNGFDFHQLYSDPLPFPYSDSFSQETVSGAWSLEPDGLDVNAGSVPYSLFVRVA